MCSTLLLGLLVRIAAGQGPTSPPAAASVDNDGRIRIVSEGATPEEPLVVLVRGFAGRDSTWDALRAALDVRGGRMAVGEFRYTVAPPLDQVARDLAQAVKEFPGRPVYLVGHSLGGAIARLAVEDPALDPGPVKLVVSLGSPADDALLAPLEEGLAAAEHALGRERVGRRWVPVRAILGTLRTRLARNRRALRRLAERPRNGEIEVHAIVGTRAPLPPVVAELLRRTVDVGASMLPAGSPLTPVVKASIPPIASLESGAGDGVVSHASSAIPGIDPVRIAASHSDLPKDPRAVDTVVRWLLARRVRDLAL